MCHICKFCTCTFATTCRYAAWDSEDPALQWTVLQGYWELEGATRTRSRDRYDMMHKDDENLLILVPSTSYHDIFVMKRSWKLGFKPKLVRDEFCSFLRLQTGSWLHAAVVSFQRCNCELSSAIQRGCKIMFWPL